MKKIINNILSRLKEDSLAKRIELAERIVSYKELDKLRTCLLFYTAGEEPKGAIEVLKKKMPGVKFGKLCFVPSGTEITETEHVVFFRYEELGFGGKIQNESLYEELSKEYDLLVDFTATSNVMTQFVLSNSKAHCIVGMKREGAVGEILIDGAKDQRGFAVELVNLLAGINSY
ncbi:MAG: hypothetical protein K2L23_03005 [Odoribacter sp.]|nr:hypothetical protein [Odoribacter sp.]